MKKLVPVFAIVLLLLPGLCLGDTLKIKGTSVELRAEPDREARVIAYAGEGKEFEIVKTLASGWYSVRLPNDMVVWVERGDDIEVSRRVTAEAPSPKVKAETKKVGKEKPAVAPPPERVAKKGKEAAAGPAVVKPKEAPAPEKKKEAAAAAKAEVEEPPAPPAAAEKLEEAVAKKPEAELARVEENRGPPPQLTLIPEQGEATSFLTSVLAYAPQMLGLIFGVVYLFLAKWKRRSKLIWFTLGAYFPLILHPIIPLIVKLIIILLIVILIKKKREEPVAPGMVLKIVSIVFLVIFFPIGGGVTTLFNMYTKTFFQDQQVIRTKVNLYVKQIHKGNYKGAHLLLSPEGQRLAPYKRFVKTNETVHNALGDLKQFKEPDIIGGYGDKPTTLIVKSVFEKGEGNIKFTLKKEGGIMRRFRPGEWGIVSVKTSSLRIQQYIRQQKKASQ